MKYNPWDEIDYMETCDHYNERVSTHRELEKAFNEQRIKEYIYLALGISNKSGNYSAHEHGLGPKVLSQSKPEQVFNLAKKLIACNSPQELPDIIYRENLPFLKISVGTEMSMMLKPDICWVINIRTMWAHLVLQQNGNIELANQALSLYRDANRDSALEYRIWQDQYEPVGKSLLQLAELGTQSAIKRNLKPGTLNFLWGDAIADTMYNKYSKLR